MLLSLKNWGKQILFSEIKTYRVENPNTKLGDLWKLAYFSPQNLQKHTLKLLDCSSGQDLYGIDPTALEQLTTERIESILREQRLRKAIPKAKKRYLVSYIIKMEHGYEEVEEEVEPVYRKFMGKDGKQHHLLEKGLKIIQRII